MLKNTEQPKNMKSWFNYSDIMNGGTIEFVLGDVMNKGFASSEMTCPPSFSDNN
ncbi:hypothetical protein [Labilibaculum sp.]|uniref:hypothetical protein n=1 Tax=Labilibaculum sp. TaxID=2060723 RepID=UPI002AA7FBBB|nr:hypothetical protein [Labilibaculum sp.]MBN2597861.1 hypothetical protein [Marinifilaceae bacterium]